MKTQPTDYTALLAKIMPRNNKGTPAQIAALQGSIIRGKELVK